LKRYLKFHPLTFRIRYESVWEKSAFCSDSDIPQSY
jgi:hypothetical protein